MKTRLSALTAKPTMSIGLVLQTTRNKQRVGATSAVVKSTGLGIKQK